MPYLQERELMLPFGGRSPRARRTSLQGAQVAVTRAGSQCARLLIAYLHYGPSTDLEQAVRVGLPEARVSARRNNLINRKLVQYSGADRRGPSGAESCLWTLSPYGREVATELASS